jgi:RNase P/RNase MRP subunit p29
LEWNRIDAAERGARRLRRRSSGDDDERDATRGRTSDGATARTRRAMKASRIADLEARMRGRASRETASSAATTTARDADADPTTSYYAPSIGEDEETFAGARATAREEAAARRAYAEAYARRMLATRRRGTSADAEDDLRAKLSADKALVLVNDWERVVDAGEARAREREKRFAEARRAMMSKTRLKREGLYGLRPEQCTWSAFSKLRGLWEKYARALVKDAKRGEAEARLTRGLDLHGCVLKVVRHARAPDLVGREGVVAFISSRCLWLVARKREKPIKVLIDGGTFEFVLDERVVRLSSEDVLASAPRPS